jgi:hypothetical protein
MGALHLHTGISTTSEAAFLEDSALEIDSFFEDLKLFNSILNDEDSMPRFPTQATALSFGAQILSDLFDCPIQEFQNLTDAASTCLDSARSAYQLGEESPEPYSQLEEALDLARAGKDPAEERFAYLQNQAQGEQLQEH